VDLLVYTTAFRLVGQKNFPHPGGASLFVLEMTDTWGDPLPNGVFYLKVTVTDPSGKKTSKTMTLVVRR